MRKEIFFAIAAGGILGLVIAFGIYRANVALKPTATEQSDNINEQKSVPPKKLELAISSPSDQAIVSQSVAEIDVVTLPGAQIVFSGEEKDVLAQTDNQGVAKAKVDLIGGLNQIQVNAFDASGNSVTKSLLLVYSTQLTPPASQNQTDTPNATDTSDTVREKVAQKLKEVSQKSVAYVGSVTDITDSTLQIKSYTSGDVKQISIDKDTTVFVTDVTSKKTSTFEDLAIGDFIVAMGYENGQQVLLAQRILITSPISQSKITVLDLLVSSIDSKTKLTGKTKSNQDPWEVNFAKSWKGPDLKDLDSEQEIFVVGSKKDDTTLDSTRAILLPSSQ